MGGAEKPAIAGTEGARVVTMATCPSLVRVNARLAGPAVAFRTSWSDGAAVLRQGPYPIDGGRILRPLRRKPAERYESVQSLADDIEHWLADEPVSAYPEPMAARLSRWGRRHRTLVAGVGASRIIHRHAGCERFCA